MCLDCRTCIDTFLLIVGIFIKVFILKIALGFLDVSTDLINGFNFWNGEFAMGVYFASDTRVLFDKISDGTVWGTLTLALVWLPGAVRVTDLAMRQSWGEFTVTRATLQLLSYGLLIPVFPVFSLFPLFLGLLPRWRERKFCFLGLQWGYEEAVLDKGYECFLESGFQTLLQSYIQIRTGWHGWQNAGNWWGGLTKDFLTDEGYRIRDVKFSVPQIIGFVSYPFSIISLVTGTIYWHFHRKDIIEKKLKISDVVKVAPFFTMIIVTKVWVTADVCATLHTLAETMVEQKNWPEVSIQIAKSLSFSLPFIAQMILSLKMKHSFKKTVMNCLANQISLWRPTHKKEKEPSLLPLYKSETRLSSVIYLVLATTSLCLKQADLIPENNWNQIWTSKAAMGFAIAYLFVTQLYTTCLSGLLFEKEIKIT